MSLDIHIAKERHPIRWIFLIILVLLIGTIGWFSYRWYTTGELPPFPFPIASADSSVDESDVSTVQVESYKVPETHPRYIRIPVLDVDNSRIYPVALDANNLLAAASNIHDAAWYDKSGTPGDGGVILISGHSVGVSKNGIFAKLGTLVKGDKIALERGDGEVFNYKVVENQSMTIDEVNQTGMKTMGKSAKPGIEGLNLITDDGKWIPRLSTFDRRVMLRAIIDAKTQALTPKSTDI